MTAQSVARLALALQRPIEEIGAEAVELFDHSITLHMPPGGTVTHIIIRQAGESHDITALRVPSVLVAPLYVHVVASFTCATAEDIGPTLLRLAKAAPLWPAPRQ